MRYFYIISIVEGLFNFLSIGKHKLIPRSVEFQHPNLLLVLLNTLEMTKSFLGIVVF